ncbi:DUF4224 domain-containing protein [Burkholderia ubonensis]|uniref:Uncharacterized protein n=1 Tax=Burkholderia ubonensis TaxID=101571 RepID=A0A119MDT2_9BURK|nr:DUF4224 domain-containing protein [Burkholderia ubonensis]KWD88461.1 hypothetical protein WL70_07320 [Burkholderia ubonensis]KWD88783.1 hypothetical protein WL72_34395 [Burkholderia ubonensis]KWD89542.1 hypothetical protein WL71_09070 [Burkholderia ubonensis]KWD94548.1 hypothetical protein WL73_25695 [Burkholderia ubonensis]
MSFKILTEDQLEQITGKKRYSAQVAWFRETFGAEPALRANGSIVMTQSAFEQLLLKRLGIETKPADLRDEPRPPVYPVHKKQR